MFMRCCYLSVTAEKNNNPRCYHASLRTYLLITSYTNQGIAASWRNDSLYSASPRAHVGKALCHEHFLPFSAFWMLGFNDVSDYFAYLLGRTRLWLRFSIDGIFLDGELVGNRGGSELAAFKPVGLNLKCK